MSPTLSKHFDVVVLGGGNAALTAAITEARAGRRVVVLEAAPRFYCGGNTRHHTRDLRCSHDGTAPTLLEGNKPSGNMFAAGEIMAANVLGKGYLAGSMTIGAVFGRLAGEGAARHAHN